MQAGEAQGSRGGLPSSSRNSTIAANNGPARPFLPPGSSGAFVNTNINNSERQNGEELISGSPREPSGSHSPPARLAKGAKTGAAGRLACEICRERKVRCDREWPKCGRCTRLGDNCCYKARGRHRQSQSDLPRQVKQLQDRLSRAEERLSTQQPPQSLHSLIAPTPPPEVDLLPLNQHDLSRPISPSSKDRMETGEEPTDGPAGMDMSVPNPVYGYGVDWLANMPNDASDLAPAGLDWLNNTTPADFITDEGGLIFANGVMGSESQPAPMGRMSVVSLAEQSSEPTSAHGSLVQRSGSGPPTVGFPDEQLTPSDLRELHNSYFNVFYPTMPILTSDRFFSRIQAYQDAPQIQALSYGVALIGTMVSPDHRHFESACLDKVRKCVELCERDEDMPMMLSLDLFQALLFLVRFELARRTILRAWVTVGRAVRLANILGLHLNNPEAGASDVHLGLPPTSDPVCMEERRRALWTLFICETYASARARLPPLLQEDQITIPLPAPGILTSDFVPLPTPTLAESYAVNDCNECNISSFAGIVLACAIARRCQPHGVADAVAEPSPGLNSTTRQLQPQSYLSQPPINSSVSVKGFWDRHFSLLTILKHRIGLLSPHLTVRAVQNDPVSFALYVYLCGVDISLQETAVAQVEKQALSSVLAADSAKRSREAAYRLVGVARGTLPKHHSEPDYFTLHGAFMARPVATAVQVLGRDLHARPDGQNSSTVADSIQMLLGALDRMEEIGGFWHGTVAATAQAVREWEEVHGNRSADTWAAALVQPHQEGHF